MVLNQHACKNIRQSSRLLVYIALRMSWLKAYPGKHLREMLYRFRRLLGPDNELKTTFQESRDATLCALTSAFQLRQVHSNLGLQSAPSLHSISKVEFCLLC